MPLPSRQTCKARSYRSKTGMNTFLPHKSFKKSAQVLDYKRLGNQRSETWQIIDILVFHKESRWKSHPAIKLWQGYEKALIKYGIEICREWIRRGYIDNMLPRFLKLQEELGNMNMIYPPILFKKESTDSHKSNLLRKDKAYYSKYFSGIPDNLPYVWK